MGGNVIYYIPDRETEGYGLNKGAIDTLAAKGTGLIVTVDNGISSLDEAEYIYRLGMQLVVTDHHQVGEQLPRAEAVVNPHRTDNQLPFTDFAGWAWPLSWPAVCMTVSRRNCWSSSATWLPSALWVIWFPW